MQDSKSYLDTKLKDDDELDVPLPKSPEDLVDEFGIRASLVILCIALLIAAFDFVAFRLLHRNFQNLLGTHSCFGTCLHCVTAENACPLTPG
jgi:hypothetical protein